MKVPQNLAIFYGPSHLGWNVKMMQQSFLETYLRWLSSWKLTTPLGPSEPFLPSDQFDMIFLETCWKLFSE